MYTEYMQKISLTLGALILVGVLFMVFQKSPASQPLNENNTSATADLSGDKCYSRSVVATKELPFSVDEYMKLNFTDDTVIGTKFGFQAGPGVSNGYTGTLKGTRNDTEIVLDYAYTVEGSQNTETEIYAFAGETIEKINYVLVEKTDGLVPDRSQEVMRLQYVPVDCSVFETKLPK